jgi:hypothetical protein
MAITRTLSRTLVTATVPAVLILGGASPALADGDHNNDNNHCWCNDNWDNNNCDNNNHCWCDNNNHDCDDDNNHNNNNHDCDDNNNHDWK